MSVFSKVAVMLVTTIVLSGGAMARNEVEQVGSLQDLNRVITEMSMHLDSTRKIKLLPPYTNAEFEEFMGTSIFSDYASRWYFKYKSQNSPLNLRLVFYEDTCLLAAFRNSKLEKKLSIMENRALDELRKRVEKLNVPGMNRLEKIRILHDDTRLRQIKFSDREKSRSCVDLLIGKTVHPHAKMRYISLMLKCLDIPTRYVWAEPERRPPVGVSILSNWNMVQLEDSSWYHVVEGEFFSDREMARTYKWDDGKYPAASQKFMFRVVTCRNSKEFWKAAQTAFDKGASSFSSIVENYRGKSEFDKSYTDYVVAGGTLSCTDKYLPGGAGKDVLIRVVFNTEEESPAADDETKDREFLSPEGKSPGRFRKLKEDEPEAGKVDET